METVQSTDARYPYEGRRRSTNNLYPVQMIYSVKNTLTNEIITPFQFLLTAGISCVEFVGFKKECLDSNYHLLTMQRNMLIGENLAIELNNDECRNIFGVGIAFDDSESRDVINIDYFDLNPFQSINDLTSKLHMVRDTITTTNTKKLLGAIMISCCARDSFMKKDDADRAIFASVFDKVSCSGFSANGEIGPTPLVIDSSSSSGSNCNTDIFQKGNVNIHAYTVICAMILSNEKEDDEGVHTSTNERGNTFDDREENVQEFIRKRLLCK